MQSKVIKLMLFFLIVFSFNVCFAEDEDWEEIGDNKYVDMNSILKYEVDGIVYIDAVVKIIEKDGSIDIYRLYVNTDNFMVIAITGDFYHANGQKYYEIHHDYHDASLWKDCSNEDFIHQIVDWAEGLPIPVLDELP